MNINRVSSFMHLICRKGLLSTGHIDISSLQKVSYQQQSKFRRRLHKVPTAWSTCLHTRKQGRHHRCVHSQRAPTLAKFAAGWCATQAHELMIGRVQCSPAPVGAVDCAGLGVGAALGLVGVVGAVLVGAVLGVGVVAPHARYQGTRPTVSRYRTCGRSTPCRHAPSQ
jgi:hypothetical protein